MNIHKQLISALLLLSFLLMGGLFGTRAFCIEADGDVFPTSIFSRSAETDNDSYENDPLPADEQTHFTLEKNLSESFLIVFMSDDTITSSDLKLQLPALFLTKLMTQFSTFSLTASRITPYLSIIEHLGLHSRLVLIRSTILIC